MFITVQIRILLGVPVAIVRGANPPLLQRMVLREMQLEKQALQGERTRKAINLEIGLAEDRKNTTLHTCYNPLSLVMYSMFNGNFEKNTR